MITRKDLFRGDISALVCTIIKIISDFNSQNDPIWKVDRKPDMSIDVDIVSELENLGSKRPHVGNLLFHNGFKRGSRKLV